MKKTTLEIVNKCLESVNYEQTANLTGRDAQKVLSILEDCFYDLVSRTDFPRHRLLTTITATETTANPTTFSIEDSTTDFVKHLRRVEYNIAGSVYATEPLFKEIRYLEPDEFLDRSNNVNTDYVVVSVDTDTFIKVRDNKYPDYWTTFDQKTLYMDSYDADVESFLITEKTRVMFEKFPVFLSGASDIQNIDSQYFSVLIREAQSMCHAILKDGINQKVEQSARTNRVMYQNDKKKARFNGRRATGRN